MNKDVT